MRRRRSKEEKREEDEREEGVKRKEETHEKYDRRRAGEKINSDARERVFRSSVVRLGLKQLNTEDDTLCERKFPSLK